jgi:methyl-accepting chemotaxis protein
MSYTIGKKLVIGFGSITAITLVMGGISVYEVNRIHADVTSLKSDCLPGVSLTGQIESRIRENYANFAFAAGATTPELRDLYAARFDQVAGRISELATEYEKTLDHAQEKELFEQFKQSRAEYLPEVRAQLALLASGDRKAAEEHLKHVAEPKFAAFTATAAKMSDWNLQETRQMSDELEAVAIEARNIALICMGVASVVSLLMGLFIIRSLKRSLSQITATLGTGAEQTASASGQVSASSQSLAQGASEQAASLEETSSALEEMSSMTRKNADTAQQAAALASDAQQAASRGNGSMQRMSSAIDDIQTSAQETAKIIKVIDEIAFQTNLLALNAAVEAARAGEAGKGFAVVAEEVRNLAMRSAEAAKNTAGLIEQSVTNAKNGVTIADQVGKSLGEIVESTDKVSGLINEIAASSKEQSQGIEQINNSISQMDKVTQTNAANAEESAAASEELSSQAEQLRSCVRDLIAIVDGPSKAGEPTTGAGLRLARPASALKGLNGSKAPSSKGWASKPKSGTSASSTETVTTPKRSAAKDVIPFDNDVSTPSGDFGEFSKAA